MQLFGAISSPFICTHILQQTARDYKEEFTVIADKVASNFYVDNLLDSFDTEDEAIHFVNRMRLLLKRGGFHLNQWLSSSRKVLSVIPSEDLNQPTLNLEFDKLPSESTLGVLGDSESDSFKFKINVESELKTKRNILSAVSAFFDPLGLLAAVVLTAKRFYRIFGKLKQVGMTYVIPTFGRN